MKLFVEHFNVFKQVRHGVPVGPVARGNAYPMKPVGEVLPSPDLRLSLAGGRPNKSR